YGAPPRLHSFPTRRSSDLGPSTENGPSNGARLSSHQTAESAAGGPGSRQRSTRMCHSRPSGAVTVRSGQSSARRCSTASCREVRITRSRFRPKRKRRRVTRPICPEKRTNKTKLRVGRQERRHPVSDTAGPGGEVVK